MPKRRKFTRPLGERRYRKLFIIAVEGLKTEPQYFTILRNLRNHQAMTEVICLKGGSNSSPLHVLKRMGNRLKNQTLQASDEAWLVVDRDKWTDGQLNRLYEWSKGADNYGFALSNPKFEYWLLLHFEDGRGIGSPRKCSDRLKKHLPGYDKGIDNRKITIDMINKAIDRAKDRDKPKCSDWPRCIGNTTVYRLVENIIGTIDPVN